MSDQDAHTVVPQGEPAQTKKLGLFSAIQQVMSENNKSQSELVEFSVHGKLLNFTKDSLFILSPENKVRLWTIWLTEWIWFDRFIILVILLNSILLATQDYSWRLNNSEAPASWTDNLEYLFTAIFIVEFVLKIMSMGFMFDKQTYLRDGWNFIDFVVVITGIISLFISARVSAIRIIRILRPLRSINSFKEMKVLIATLLEALPQLGNVVIFLLFIVFLFGILGLQIFLGTLENRCRLTPEPVGGVWLPSNYDKLCQDTSDCPNGTYCGNPSNYNLPKQEQDDELFNYGYTNFDNIITAIFTIFQALTTEGWTKLIFIYQEAVAPAIVYIYFLLLIFIGAFFVVNLILAVINDKFVEQERLKKSFTQTISSQQQEDEQNEESQHIVEQQSLTQVNNLQSEPQVQQPQPRDDFIESIHMENTAQPQQRQRRQSRKRTITQTMTKFHQFQQLLIVILDHKYFSFFITAVIFMNTLILSLDRYPISDAESNTYTVLNQIFTVIFSLEMTLKMVAFGKNYYRDSMNLFDAIIVILSLIEWILNSVGNNSSGGSFSAMQAFRTLRLFRLFKLARTWTSFRKLLAAIAATLSGVVYFVILLFLFMSVAALLGMELFAYKSSIRYNYDNYLMAMLSVFLLLTNESWNTIAYTYMHDMDSIYPAIYFVIVIILGNFILLKLFIAILLNNFHSESTKSSSQSLENNQNIDTSRNEQSNRETRTKLNQISPELEQGQQSFRGIKSSSIAQTGNNSAIRQRNVSQQIMFSVNNLSSTMNTQTLEGVSLYVFQPTNIIRIKIAQLISHKYFDFFILTIIILSSILLALDDPLTDSTNYSLTIIDDIITSLFILEALLKIIAKGLIINGPDSYMRQLANLLDLVVIIFSSLSFDTNQVQTFSKIKILRVIRVLRPLRLIVRNEDLKLAINALFNSLSQMLNITLICLIFFLLFGIFGVTQFKGSYFKCDLDEVNDKWECFDKGGSWTNQNFNFDNVLNAMITLFVLSTTEGWIDIMSEGIDSRGIDLNPIESNAIPWAIYFVLFIIVGSFFIINLFAGVIVDAFQSEKERLSQMKDLNKEELIWFEIQQKIYSAFPIEHFKLSKNKHIRRLHQILESNQFEIFVLTCIILNTCIMMIQYLRQPDSLTNAIQILNWLFLGIFALEAIFKVTVYRKFYFSNGWNIFDFTVVLLTLFGVILEQSNVLSGVGTATSILRTFRIFRVLRLIKSAKELRIIFGTFIVTLPGLISIGGLLLIMIFIGAIIFMNLFPYVKRGAGITENANFSSFGVSLFTLFKCSTGEDWNLVMMDAARSSQPNDICFDFNDYQSFSQYGFMGCGNVGGILLMIVYTIIVSLIMLNLFVAVIIEGFSKTSEEENQKIKKSDIENFQQIWKLFDKFATGYIQCKYFTQFMMMVDKPLGWHDKDKKEKLSAIQQRIKTSQLSIPVYIVKNKCVYHFHQVLICLAQEYLETDGFVNDFSIKKEIVKLKLQPLIEKAFSQLSLMDTEFDSSQYMAAVLIQSNAKRVLGIKKKSSTLIPQNTHDDEVQQFVIK